MKFTKNILGVSLGATALFAAGYMALNLGTSQVEAVYQPRDNAQATYEAKGSFEFINMLRANQITGKVDPADELRAMQQAQQFAQSNKTGLGLEWEEAGPDNFGGRTRAFLIDKDNNNILYAGSVSGGLFKSTNRGASWFPINDNQENLAVVSICQTANGDIYYGTGEGMYYFTSGTGSGGILGGGIFKSTDGGTTFERLQSTIPTPSNSTSAPWASVGQLIAHPSDANTVWAATNQGLWLTTDGGQNWTLQATSLLPSSSPVTDMTMASDGSMWVAFTLGRVIYSDDPIQNNWVEKTTMGAGPTDLGRSPGRQAIAVSPTDPNYVYVVQSVGLAQQGDVLHGVWRSTDKGQNWTRIGVKAPGFDPFIASHGINPSNGQASYDMAIAVPYNNKDRVLIAGVDMWDWELGNGWRKLTQWNAFRLSPIYVHADHHKLVFDPVNQNVLYLLTDGGVFRSSDVGITWSEINRNYATIQFYAFDVNEQRHIMGGTQDNGTFLLDRSGNTPNAASSVLGGDGGYAALSRLNSNVWFAESQYGNIRRTENRGESYGSPLSNRVNSPPGQGSQGFSAFVTPFLLHETTTDVKSTDSVSFVAEPAVLSLGFGNGSNRSFSGTLRKPQTTADFVVNTFRIAAGGDTVVSDANGVLSGQGTGNFDPTTGEFSVQFSRAPFAEIVILCNVSYAAGVEVNVSSNINNWPYKFTLPNALQPFDTVKVQDQVQAMLFFGNTSRTGGVNGFGGVWMTREPLDFTRTPRWWRLTPLQVGEVPKCMEITQDGNTLFVGTTGGAVYRITNINDARSLETADFDENDSTRVIETVRVANYNGRAVTGIAIDPTDPNRVVVTLGNYGNTTHVFYSANALAPTPTFLPKQGTGLPNMPVYGAVINEQAPDQVVLATDFGIYSTNNITAANVEWVRDNNGMANVPSFFIKQLINNRASNIVPRRDAEGNIVVDANGNPVMDSAVAETGDIFVGTHGRGMFRTGTTKVQNAFSTGDDALNSALAQDKNAIAVYPNPAVDYTKVQFELENRAKVAITIRDINGRLVKTVNFPALNRGAHALSIDTDDLRTGNYFITVSAGEFTASAKLMVTK
ncbi:MAG: T9SS type A sorting domain-containing protein [Schleiferiaceae bacterium]|nr:T9SS type A sorting domain-containing protein [Schleiferiaceae bacterium]